MNIYPAIDLMAGRVVRLAQGNFDAVTRYADDPVTTAASFAEQGMKRLHIVDLDGARTGQVQQAPLVKQMVANLKLHVQIGGGIRTETQVEAYLACGVRRIVIGSLAIKDPARLDHFIETFGAEYFTLAVDFSRHENGEARVALQGWQESGELSPVEVMRTWHARGIRYFLATDISRDGMMTGPDFALYRNWQTEFSDSEIQVSGGVGTLEDLTRLSREGARAVIVGKALYEGKINLREANFC